MYDRRHFLGLSGSAAALAFLPRTAGAKTLTPEEVFEDADAPILGNPDGDVTIAEFFDYQCSWCKKIHPDVMDVVAEDGNVRLMMKDWPVFGEASVFAAQVALGAAQFGKYRTVMDTLLGMSGRLSLETVSEAVEHRGIAMDDIAAAVRANNDKISGLLTRNWHQAEAFGFTGTPSFGIGTTTYRGALNKKALREAIAKARG